MFSQGSGVDSQGVWWRGGGEDNIAPVDLAPADPTADLAQALGLAMLGVDNFVCSLATKCHADLDCSAVGSRKALGLGLSKGILRSEWGYCALTSLININEQLSNQYNSIQGASIRAIAETFRIDNFYKAPDQKFDIRNAMLGLGTAFSILGGFAPAIAPVTGIGGAALSAVGGFLGNIISESLDLNVVQKTYASKVEDVYKQYVNTIDNMTTILLKGQDIEPGVNIRTMMRNGSWSDYSTLTPISAIEQSLKIEILSRSIDALWKKPPSNKMWVLYVDLNDDRSTTTKCIQDQTGPQELKYCADRGIYYAYNYIEDGHLQGHIDYPPGAAMLKKIDIQPNWIAEASARTFRLAKNVTYGLDPFNFDARAITKSFLFDIANVQNELDLTNLAGRYPGSWTLPVCDTSTWGGRWNFNIKMPSSSNIVIEEIPLFNVPNKFYTRGSPPCICGPNGEDTKSWVKAAGLQGSDTFYHFCKKQLESKDFPWPESIRCVDYGFNEPIKRPGTTTC